MELAYEIFNIGVVSIIKLSCKKRDCNAWRKSSTKSFHMSILKISWIKALQVILNLTITVWRNSFEYIIISEGTI